MKIRLVFFQREAQRFHISLTTFRTKRLELRHAGDYLDKNQVSGICTSWKTVWSSCHKEMPLLSDGSNVITW